MDERKIQGSGDHPCSPAAALPLVIGLLLPSSAAPSDDFEAGQISVILRPGYTIEAVNATWGTTTVDAYPPADLYLVYIEGVEDLESFADEMNEDPAVEQAEANYRQETPEGVRQMVVVAVGGTYVDYEDQEITERIQLDLAHETTRGAGITVAVLDTGVDPEHEALTGLLDPGFDFVDGDAEPWESANGTDDDGDLLVDEGYGHGTMVAGVVALVAPEARILPIRVLDDEGRGDVHNVAKAIHWAVAQGADVLNLSFGLSISVETIGFFLEHCEEAGISVVAAAGNESHEEPALFPARANSAVMVTALDSLDVKADFADWNRKVLVSAPGTGVRSAYPGGEWALGAGCSFATPFVTGEAALVRSLLLDPGPEHVREDLAAAVDPIYENPGNEPYEDELGSGRINLAKAVAALVVGAPIAAPSTPIPFHLAPNPTPGPISFWAADTNAGVTALTAEIFDATGRRVASVRGRSSTLRWDGRDHRNIPVRPGVYFARLGSGSERPTASFLVIR